MCQFDINLICNNSIQSSEEHTYAIIISVLLWESYVTLVSGLQGYYIFQRWVAVAFLSINRNFMNCMYVYIPIFHNTNILEPTPKFMELYTNFGETTSFGYEMKSSSCQKFEYWISYSEIFVKQVKLKNCRILKEYNTNTNLL